MKAIRVLAASAVLAGLVATACTTTKLTSTWVDESRTARPFQNLLVVGIAESPGKRRAFEDRFVAALAEIGVSAVPSASVLPDDVKLDKESIESHIQGRDIDGVIATHLLGVDEETRYNPPTTYVVPATYHGFYGYYGGVFDYVNSPGYYSTHVDVRLETNLYDAASAKLVWSAQSSTFDPPSDDKTMDSVIGVVIKELQKQGLLG